MDEQSEVGSGLPVAAGGTSTVPRGEPVVPHEGPLMLTIVFFGVVLSVSFERLLMIHLVTASAVTEKATGLPRPWLEATAGMPCAAAAHRGTDRARQIEDRAEILSQVDTGDDEIGMQVKLLECHPDGVGRIALHGDGRIPAERFDLHRRQCAGSGLRTGATLVGGRRDHLHGDAGQGAQRLDNGVDTGSVVPVVIGDENGERFRSALG